MVVWGVCGRGQEVRSVCAFVFGLFTSFLYLISEGVFVIFAYGSLICCLSGVFVFVPCAVVLLPWRMVFVTV